MSADEPPGLARLVAAVAATPKYRHVSPELIAALGRRELTRRASLAEAIKETKGALHQAAGAYLPGRARYDAWLGLLRAAQATGDPTALRAACREVMAHHTSTRERLPVLDAFYATTLAVLPPLSSVVDLACGLNPLAAPWMPLAPRATYRALDIYGDMAAFLNEALPLLGVVGCAEVRDVSRPPVEGWADLALLLKALPTLDHLDRDAGLRLLRSLDAPRVLISFPVRSLGGRDRGMLRTYEERFVALAAQEGWTVQRFAFATELAFLVTRVAR